MHRENKLHIKEDFPAYFLTHKLEVVENTLKLK